MFILITPLKDEIANIRKLLKSVSSQTLKIDVWIIVENDSIDGSKEYLNKVKKLDNISELIILNKSFSNKEYDIGAKYSKVVNFGFNYVESKFKLTDSDFIGLIDADSFPEEKYFEKLIRYLKDNNKCGLVSGVLRYENGRRDDSNNYNIRGSGRVWKYECFKKTGRYYGLSPDAITQRKAEIHGYTPKVITNAYFISRVANSRVSYDFIGKSTYYNGYTITFSLLKGLKITLSNYKKGIEYYNGYLQSWINDLEKNPDIEIIEYNKKYIRKLIFRKLHEYQHNKTINI